MRNVYVLGTGMVKFGRYPEKTVPELGAEALSDFGIEFVGFVVVQEEGRALGIEHSRDRGDQLLKQRA